MTTLTKENINDNLLIVCKDHQDWGVYRVLNTTQDGVWNIRNSAGDRLLFEDEFHFWRLFEPESHVCKYCGATTTQPDDECYKKHEVIWGEPLRNSKTKNL